ncbi:DUF6702 family protein [Pontibacter sp. MBLB2868]|uniref:DUF6702 family protein n=1 Tax=Pontibacter sp. MBLB2868 TaxID=3451555 RepID=UPI003F74CB1A
MKYRILSLLLAFIVIVSVPASAHDFHTSITDIQYNPRTKSLEVALKVFTDDLEKGLSRYAKSKVVYDSNSEKQQQLLAGYVKQNFTVALAKGKQLNYKVLGSEAETDAVWIYLEVPVQNASVQQLYVKNAVLTDMFADQMNIVNFNYKGSTESVLLQRGDTEKKISF